MSIIYKFLFLYYNINILRSNNYDKDFSKNRGTKVNIEIANGWIILDCQAIKLEAVTTIKWYKGNTGLYYLGLVNMHNFWITMCTFNQEAKCKQIYAKIIKILRKGNSNESN